MTLCGFGDPFGLCTGNRTGEARKLGVTAGVAVEHTFGKADKVGLAFSRSVDEVERMGQSGVDVTCDIPPYLMGMTTVTMILPTWIQEGGVGALIERLRDPDVRSRITAGDVAKSNPAAALALDGKWDKLWVFSDPAAFDLLHGSGHNRPDVERDMKDSTILRLVEGLVIPLHPLPVPIAGFQSRTTFFPA